MKDVAEAEPWRGRLIHPVTVMAAVWAVAVPAWAFAGDQVLAASITGERAGSVHAFLYFAGCLAGFAVGALLGGIAWPRRRPAGIDPSNWPGMNGVAIACTLVVLFGGLVWLVRITQAAGSPLALVDLFVSGRSVINLKSEFYTPAELPPITTLVHLAPAAASMLLIQRRIRGWDRLHWLLMAGLVALSAVRTLVLAERLAGLAMLAAILTTLLLTSRQVPRRKVAVVSLASVGLLWLAWSAGEFARSWMDTRDGNDKNLTLSNFVESMSYSQERLGAYLFTAINNGVIIVENWPGQEFPANFAPVLARAGVGSGQGGAGDLYNSELSREFTGESMPGRFYLDARDFGIALTVVYGLVFGLAWRAATLGSAAGIVLYASILPILLDSYRSAYLFDLPGVAGFGAAGAVLLASRLPRARVSSTVPVVGQAARIVSANLAQR